MPGQMDPAVHGSWTMDSIICCSIHSMNTVVDQLLACAVGLPNCCGYRWHNKLVCLFTCSPIAHLARWMGHMSMAAPFELDMYTSDTDKLTHS